MSLKPSYTLIFLIFNFILLVLTNVHTFVTKVLAEMQFLCLALVTAKEYVKPRHPDMKTVVEGYNAITAIRLTKPLF